MHIIMPSNVIGTGLGNAISAFGRNFAPEDTFFYVVGPEVEELQPGWREQVNREYQKSPGSVGVLYLDGFRKNVVIRHPNGDNTKTVQFA
jgi:hypothetical protein